MIIFQITFFLKSTGVAYVCVVVLHTNRQISMFQEVYWNRKANNLLEPELCVSSKDGYWKIWTGSITECLRKIISEFQRITLLTQEESQKLVVMYISSRYHLQLCSDMIKNSNKNLNIKKTSKMINTMNHELKHINSKLSLFTVKVWLKFTCSKSASKTFAVRSSSNTRYSCRPSGHSHPAPANDEHT